MILLTNNAEQTVQPGEVVNYNVRVMKTGNAECTLLGTGSVKMRAQGIYSVSFGANVTGATAGTPVQLSFRLGGEAIIPGTDMIYTPAVANAFGNVSKSIPVSNRCCDFDRISVANTGTEPITIGANPSFAIRRVA